MKNLLFTILAAVVLTFCGCKESKSSSASDEPVSKNKYVNYLQKDLDDENANQFIIDLGKASERFLNLSKTDVDKAKEHINDVRNFVKDNQRAIDKLTKDNERLEDVVDKFMKIDPESAEALNKYSK